MLEGYSAVFSYSRLQIGGRHRHVRSTCGPRCGWLMAGHILSAPRTLLTTSGRLTARAITEHTRHAHRRVFNYCKCGVHRPIRGRNRRISARQWSSWRVCFLELQPAVCGLMRRRSPRPTRSGCSRGHGRLQRLRAALAQLERHRTLSCARGWPVGITRGL